MNICTAYVSAGYALIIIMISEGTFDVNSVSIVYTSAHAWFVYSKCWTHKISTYFHMSFAISNDQKNLYIKTCIYIYKHGTIFYIYIYIIFQFTLDFHVNPKFVPNKCHLSTQTPSENPEPPRCLCHLLASSKHLSSGNRSRTDSWCVQECRLIESSFFLYLLKSSLENWWFWLKRVCISRRLNHICNHQVCNIYVTKDLLFWNLIGTLVL